MTGEVRRGEAPSKEDDRLAAMIARLKKEHNAVILAHNYQRPEIQDIADFTGDSLELSREAAATDAGVIVFCGVHFMAETAAILCPDKIVLLPDPAAGCRMADMITVERLRQRKSELPRVPVACYVNSSAAVKAESDICCTSANALKVVESFAGDEVLFVPDRFLGANIARQTNKKMHLWPGFCPTHARILPEDIIALREKHPLAKVVVHPECRPEVIALADDVLSTGGMCRFARETDATEIIVGTETGIIHRLQKENPGKMFIPASEKAVCPNMKLVTLEKVLWSLEDMAFRVVVPEDVASKARRSIDAMMRLA
jgi:quinolinate synthase